MADMGSESCRGVGEGSVATSGLSGILKPSAVTGTTLGGLTVP